MPPAGWWMVSRCTGAALAGTRQLGSGQSIALGVQRDVGAAVGQASHCNVIGTVAPLGTRMASVSPAVGRPDRRARRGWHRSCVPDQWSTPLLPADWIHSTPALRAPATAAAVELGVTVPSPRRVPGKPSELVAIFEAPPARSAAAAWRRSRCWSSTQYRYRSWRRGAIWCTISATAVPCSLSSTSLAVVVRPGLHRLPGRELAGDPSAASAGEPAIDDGDRSRRAVDLRVAVCQTSAPLRPTPSETGQRVGLRPHRAGDRSDSGRGGQGAAAVPGTTALTTCPTVDPARARRRPTPRPQFVLRGTADGHRAPAAVCEARFRSEPLGDTWTRRAATAAERVAAAGSSAADPARCGGGQRPWLPRTAVARSGGCDRPRRPRGGGGQGNGQRRGERDRPDPGQRERSPPRPPTHGRRSVTQQLRRRQNLGDASPIGRV